MNLVDGKPGEFTVSVGDHVVAKKKWFLLPSPEKVRQAVKAEPTA
ncbi:MAG TPA: hypothetical protein VMS17_19470 [Gemmataceae bacterium]|nr:hypothetical protein [Gemmataceae bacterium]